MELRRLGRSDLRVSKLGLGTMTWGEQNTEDEAHAQLDLALDLGVNFVDTAEMYPVATRAETAGRTEAYLGTWLAKPGHRERVVLATKIVGPARGIAWIRGGETRFDAHHLNAAVEGSLQRLRTDTLDLFQLHWPDRSVPLFGRLEYRHDGNEQATPLDETLRALDDLVRSGKVRYVGVSNETPWGLMKLLALAEQAVGPRMVAIQNAYSLLNRTFEIGLSEICHREEVGLLAYSSLAMGLLTGKYAGGARPEGARLTLFPAFTRYMTEKGHERAPVYAALAQQHGLDPAQMALAYVASRPFVASTLVGATTLAQLRTNLGAADVVLSAEVLKGIEAIHRAWPNPCP